jgi:hypothetical protein
MGCLTRSEPALSRDLCNLFPSILPSSPTFILFCRLRRSTRIHNCGFSWGQLPPLVGARVEHAKASRRRCRAEVDKTARGTRRHTTPSLFLWRIFGLALVICCFSRLSTMPLTVLASVSLLALVVTGRPILAPDPRLCVSVVWRWFATVLITLPSASRRPARFTMPFTLLLSPDLGMSVAFNWIRHCFP